jgi:hypothetical protein
VAGSSNAKVNPCTLSRCELKVPADAASVVLEFEAMRKRVKEYVGL